VAAWETTKMALFRIIRNTRRKLDGRDCAQYYAQSPLILDCHQAPRKCVGYPSTQRLNVTSPMTIVIATKLRKTSRGLLPRASRYITDLTLKLPSPQRSISPVLTCQTLFQSESVIINAVSIDPGILLSLKELKLMSVSVTFLGGHDVFLEFRVSTIGKSSVSQPKIRNEPHVRSPRTSHIANCTLLAGNQPRRVTVN
jgi:hypothetical protein